MANVLDARQSFGKQVQNIKEYYETKIKNNDMTEGDHSDYKRIQNLATNVKWFDSNY